MSEKENGRREFRRKRRARNRAIAFIVLIVLATLLVVGGYFLVTYGLEGFKKTSAPAGDSTAVPEAEAGPGEQTAAEEEVP